MLSQKRLRELLLYSPERGFFTWKITKGKIKANSIAGTLHRDGRRQIQIDGRIYKEHRLAWFYVYGYMPDELDHINRNAADNRLVNLRLCSHQENLLNRGKYRNNTSGFPGVSWDRRRGQWEAYARLDGRRKFIGRFDDFEKAVKARTDFCNKNYGEFYLQNGDQVRELVFTKKQQVAA